MCTDQRICTCPQNAASRLRVSSASAAALPETHRSARYVAELILGHIWHRHGVRAPGIDLAAEAKSTGAVMVEPVDNHRWRAAELDGTLSDDRLVLAAQRADVIGVDSPLGWPAAFVSAVTAHHALQPWPGPTKRATLTHRETDRAVRALAVGTPLSVSADKLGSVAMRCALLQRRWADEGWTRPALRDGSGPLVETYPPQPSRRGTSRAGDTRTAAIMTRRNESASRSSTRSSTTVAAIAPPAAA